MTDKRTAAIIVLLLALTGANIAQQGGYAASVVRDQAGAPDSQLFSSAFWFVWLPLAALSAFAGLWGAYRSLREGNLSNGWLTLFAVLFSLTLVIDGVELGWAYVRLGINIKFGRIGLGVNFVGITLLTALWIERGRSFVVASQVAEAGPT